MPGSEFRFRIVAQDKSEEAAKKVEARYGKLAKRLDTFGKLFDRFGLKSPLGDFGKGFDDLGKASGIAVRGLADGEEAIGGFAAIAGEAIPIVGGLALGTTAAATAAFVLGKSYANAGFDVARASALIGDSAEDLQALRGAGEVAGVAASQTDAALQGLGAAIQNAKAGGDNPLLARMSAWGIGFKTLKDGTVDTTSALLDVAGAMEKIPGVQAKQRFAAAFGISAALPLLLRGRAAMQSYMRDYERSGAALSAEDQRRGNQFHQDSVELGERVRAVRNDLGRLFEGPADLGVRTLIGGIERVDGWLKSLDARIDGVANSFDRLDHVAENFAGGAAFAATSLTPFAWLGMVDPGQVGRDAKRGVAGLLGDRDTAEAPEGRGGKIRNSRATAKPAPKGPGLFDRIEKFGGDVFDAFADQIEHQESRGRQFDRAGRPLTSPAGAVGVMQLEPDTARAAAHRLGVPFDTERLRHDAGYNRQLGREELRHLLQRYGGDMTLASAAYNAGPGRVDRWLKRFGDPRKGEISDEAFAANIPHRNRRQFQETFDYVQAFTHAPRVQPEAPRPPARAQDRVNGGSLQIADVRGVLEAPREVAASHNTETTHHVATVHHHAVTATHHHRHAAPAAPPQLLAPETRQYAQAGSPGGGAIAPTPAAYSPDDANGVRGVAAPQRVTVEIVHRNAPRGTVTRVQASPQVDVALRTERALNSETAA